MSKYLKHGMLLLYLDQCVLSRFLATSENEKWRELCDVISRGSAERRFLCPMSLEHLVESSGLATREAVFLDDVIRKLSLGWSLLPEPKLIVKQIIGRLRRIPNKPEHFMQKGLWQPIANSATLTALKEMKEVLDQHNATTMRGANEINALIRNGRRPTPEMLRFGLRRRTDQYVKQLVAQLTVSMALGGVTIRAKKGAASVKDWISVVLFHLVQDEKFSLLEAQELYDILMTEKLDFIPTLKIKAELEALQFYRRGNIKPADQYDITRSACALPYADIFVTDGAKASAIRDLRLDTIFNTEVFSLRKRELPSLVTRLANRRGQLLKPETVSAARC